MNRRVMPILNAIGCLVLGGFIIVQWRGGQSLENQLREANDRISHEASARHDAEKHSQKLQAELNAVQPSIDAANEAAAKDRKATVDAEKFAADKAVEVQSLTGELGKGQEKVKEWEDAVKERDAKLKELDETLVATRARLDEAVAKLKKGKP